jgi:hypothetical protein
LGQEFGIKSRVCPKNISGNIEIGFVIRYKSGLAVDEIKEKANKRSFEQLNSICSPDVLETYIKKFNIPTHKLNENNEDLVKACTIVSIRLSSEKGSNLLKEDGNTLLEMLTSTLTHGKDRL